jgi:outer membrane protein OmpA-like peptidoglycan-associated protein
LGLNVWQAYQAQDAAQTRQTLTTVRAELHATHEQLQRATRVTDLRGQAYTPAMLAQALFPPASTRTWGYRQPDAPPSPRLILPLHFTPGSATIPPQDHADLERLGRVLTEPQYADYQIQLDGHTDSLEAPQESVVPSRERAEHVKQYLVEHFDIAPERLLVQGDGISQPRATNTTVEGRSRNRRVEVVNLGRPQR